MGIGAYNEECRSIVMRYSKDWERIVHRLGRWIDFEVRGGGRGLGAAAERRLSWWWVWWRRAGVVAYSWGGRG